MCGLIIRKLGIKSDISIHQEEDIKIPQIKRKITDFEKDEFIQESFITLKNYFKQALKKTEAGHNNVRSSLEELTNSKFVAKIYVDGDLKSVCKIWIDKGYSSNLQIHYFEGDSRSGYNNDNSYNDSAYVEDNGIEIFFRIINMGFGIIDKNVDLNKASSKDLGVYFWKNLSRI
ncbi:MAG: hypothetical protein IPM96_21695 [Ignavibacteria bacterium]|nr:hypothetical protein [Ignavibacteria bacterium]